MIPAPQTKTAWLVNERGRATIHHYIRAELVPISIRTKLADDSIGFRDGRAVAFIFACSETGAERRWGLQ